MIELPEPPSFNLTGKHALVVGGTSGIGLGCATVLARHGATVCVAARDENRIGKVVEAIKNRGWRAEGLCLDISDVESTRKHVLESGPYDILINSAGTARHSLATDTELHDYDAVMNLNVRGAYFLTCTVAKGLIEAAKPGSLINISSQMAHVGGMERAVYCASKFAVEGFTKSMAIEWGPHDIRVNTICPTFIRTPLTEPTFENPDKLQWIGERIKLNRTGTPADIMGAALYLASDASALVTGTALMVDGGWTSD